jgi:hypothetical protein
MEDKMKRILMAATLALLASPGHAGDFDFIMGTWGVMFCGAPATFEVQSQYRNTWVFEGKIRIHSTGEYDSIKIVQYDDNSLRITRYLKGANFGETQRVDTEPPRYENNGVLYYAARGRGIGCNNPGAETDLRVVRPGR